MASNKEEAQKQLKAAINAKKLNIPVGKRTKEAIKAGAASTVKKKVVAKQRIHLDKAKTQIIGTVLIVESNKRIAALLKNMLHTLRFESVIAQNGDEAIKVLKRARVIMAYVAKDLPDISGFNLCTKIRVENNGINIPIIITSESTDSSMKDQAIMVDANDHLSTPISMAGLKASVVDNLLNKDKKKADDEE